MEKLQKFSIIVFVILILSYFFAGTLSAINSAITTIIMLFVPNYEYIYL